MSDYNPDEEKKSIVDDNGHYIPATTAEEEGLKEYEKEQNKQPD